VVLSGVLNSRKTAQKGMAMHNFLPHTDADRQAMLKTIGMHSMDDLFSDIPAALRENIEYKVLPAHGLSEAELQQEMADWAQLNQGQRMACFLGGGAYSRFIPMAVNPKFRKAPYR
jgi:glycine dehydrogenase subunit 1